MANVKATYINPTGGYTQPVDPAADSISAKGLYLQTASSNDTACGIERDVSNNLILRAASTTRMTVSGTTGAVTVAAPLSGTTAMTATGFIQSSSNGFKFADGTTQTSTAATIAKLTSLTPATPVYSGNNIAYATVTGLTLPVAANTNYAFTAYLIWQMNNISGGIGFGFLGPTSPTVFDLTAIYGAGGGGAGTIRHDIAYDAMPAQTITSLPNTNYVTTFTGILFNGANAGTLAMRTCVNNGTYTYGVMAGSYLALRVIG